MAAGGSDRRTRARNAAERALPDGSERRRLAQLAREAVREGRGALRDLSAFRRRSAVSWTRPFSYREWTDATALGVGREPPSPGPEVVVALLPGPGPSAATDTSLSAGAGPVVVRDLRSSGGDGLEAYAHLLADLGPHTVVLALRDGDALEPDAAVRIADRFRTDPALELVTWDDDVGHGRDRHDPRFQPVTWSPDRLLSANPHGRSFAVRAGSAARAGGIGPRSGDDAFWDLLLRLDVAEERVAHVPRVLSHLARRPVDAGPAGVAVVTATLSRLGLPGTVSGAGDVVRIRWEPERRPLVSILVPTRHQRRLVGPLIDSLRRSTYPAWELVVVDNGGRSEENERFYRERADGIQHQVLWWDEPFNYGAVNNAAARASRGEVLVLLNDDTVVRSPDWLEQLVGWLAVPGVGTVGVQLLDPAGLIQHGGVLIGALGMADHRFQGMTPRSSSILGSTEWYWDSVANTGACVAIAAERYRAVGGLDERFELCGSDVVLGLDLRRLGLRNVCVPDVDVEHRESATRAVEVAPHDVFASYWRYARALRSGDPYHNPNVSLVTRRPELRAPDEPSALARVGPSLGRSFGGSFRQVTDVDEAHRFASLCRADDDVVAAVAALHRAEPGPIDVQEVNWFVPGFDNPFYGGLATIFRLADHLRVRHGVRNRFVVCAPENVGWFRSGLDAVFPGLGASDVVFAETFDPAELALLPAADISIATQWQTAYQVAHFPNTRRRWYLIQDFEPMFQPAGTVYALAEETYRLGLLGLANSTHLLDLYRDRYDGTGWAFTPAVDDAVFHADGRRDAGPGEPVTVFAYARPGHWRNCWELAEPALRAVKDRFGDGVRIVTAGAWADPTDLGEGIQHLGLLDYADTGRLYRTCDIGLSLTVSEHPSYLPLELMACGVPVVAFDLAAGQWILRDGVNSLLARRTVDSLTECLGALASDPGLRATIRAGGIDTIARGHADWDHNLEDLHERLSGPLDGLDSTDERPPARSIPEAPPH